MIPLLFMGEARVFVWFPFRKGAICGKLVVDWRMYRDVFKGGKL